MANESTTLEKYKLNDKQKQLVEDNHNLIWWYIWNHHLPEDDLETMECWYFVLAEALCKAAATFDASKGCKFSTYATFIMQNNVRIVWRKNNQSHVPSDLVSSCDEVIYQNDKNGNDIRLIDAIEAVNDTAGEAVSNVVLQAAMQHASEQHKLALSLTATGFKQKEIATIMGVSQPQVSRILKKYKQYFAS